MDSIINKQKDIGMYDNLYTYLFSIYYQSIAPCYFFFIKFYHFDGILDLYFFSLPPYRLAILILYLEINFTILVNLSPNDFELHLCLFLSFHGRFYFLDLLNFWFTLIFGFTSIFYLNTTCFHFVFRFQRLLTLLILFRRMNHPLVIFMLFLPIFLYHLLNLFLKLLIMIPKQFIPNCLRL